MSAGSTSGNREGRCSEDSDRASTLCHTIREHPLPGLYVTDTSCAIEHANREFKLLREYRSLLFMDVVAGKIGVGGPARRLPDDADVRVREAWTGSGGKLTAERGLSTFEEKGHGWNGLEFMS